MNNQDKKEELLNTLTHGLGFILAIICLILLLMKFHYLNNMNYVSVLIFGISMIMLYAASTLYHAFSFSKHKLIFKKIDHLAIYILIAGSYSPILLVGLQGTLGWILFSIIWCLAILGFLFKFSKYQYNKKISLTLYLGMGWLIVFALKPMLELLPNTLLLHILYGGLAYTIGAIFYAVKKIPYNHSIWHLFVMLGTTFHFLGIYFYL